MPRRAHVPLVLALTTLAAGACRDDGPTSSIAATQRSVVAIAAQTCMNPNPQRGVGVAIGAGLVVTAGHTVEGDLRSVTADGRAATIELLDRNTDLALVNVDGLDAPAIPLSAIGSDDLALIGRDEVVDVEVTSREVLVVEHASDHDTYRRHVLAFAPGVAAGASGSPLVDAQGRLAGVVILSDDETGEGIAVTAGEVEGLLAAAETEPAPTPPGDC